ncbi:type III restriction-modification system methyltransferase [Actinobacillus pleuropneumoniae]|uniref:site-specific DNA-methyltransferase n=1 Tax=Actinobacillus pleuropneumoniae TaxID=715 RepID=UPI0001E4A0C5|nr:site-specific DNA-methyltransferase [Actinobacillus pleuropneumoniae]EFM90136.1 hypothetical protein appser4_6630 [Actinobacillus pleuropneumoniae serovar 4 str. M62]UKH40962.1 site-specific DNA-methyltransferase [Actinobacillus pleuropneumoniae serovar 4 str. M62]SQF64486.1 type III restriction-modification system methyltransferase [Actinobacillus pleuropneumoniae]
MQKLKMHSADLTAQNIEKIAALFPNCVTEREVNGKLEQAIDFDLLKQELSSTIVEGNQERYQLNWVGKANATVLANAPINKTLRPCREESVNFDTTQNLFIEGDNLEALKLLQETYLGKVKMIYIDPPYNTDKDFIYKDNFAMANEDYQLESGQVDEEGNRLVVNSESNGRFHSDWLSMIYSRLKLARNLLTDDGVIFISIDDNEVANLKRICDEIFGGNNFIAQLPTIMNLKGNNDEFGFAGTHEYTLVYTNNKIDLVLNQFEINEEDLDAWMEDEIGFYKQGANLKSTGENAPREKRPNLYFPIFIDDENKIYITENDIPPNEYKGRLITIYPITDGNEMSWRWSKNKFLNEIYDVIVVRNDNGVALYKKQRPSLGDLPSKKPKTIFYKPEYSSGNGTSQIKEIFKNKLFQNPKPIELIMDFLRIGTNVNSCILDFFAGSATTAHAVMQLNAEDGGNRKFIMVQIPEQTDEKSEAHKAGYHTIAEISKERIRRAGQKIKQEKPDAADLDIGFRVLKIDSSNMADIYYNPQQIKQGDLFSQVEHIKADRTEEDLLFQVLLDWGVDLTLPIEKRVLNGKNVYFVDGNALVACFDKAIDEGIIQEIAKHQPLRSVFRDDGFVSDTAKINADQLFKQLAPHSELRVI